MVVSCVSVAEENAVGELVTFIVDAVGVIVEGVDFSCVSVEYVDTVGPLVI